ncbi:MAG: hypothetical protein GY876_02295 [Planctomycetes bacterium]|nr:hypothetical protein [Planctomycetota bacterium]
MSTSTTFSKYSSISISEFTLRYDDPTASTSRYDRGSRQYEQACLPAAQRHAHSCGDGTQDCHARAEHHYIVDFDDWESESAVRDVHFLGPDGTLVGPTYEPHFGDHAILCPNGVLDVQYMYINLAGMDGEGGGPFNGIELAKLLNP